MEVLITERQWSDYFKSVVEKIKYKPIKNFSKISHAVSYENPLTYLMAECMEEGLIHTYPIDKTVKYIKDYFSFDDQQIKVIKTGEIEKIHVLAPHIGQNVELVKKAMSLCGYYLGFPKEDKLIDGKWCLLQFEPKIEEDVSERIRKEEQFLFHLTPFYNFRKINKIGFSPRCKNTLFDYPERTYFLRGSLTDNQVFNIGYQLYKSNNNVVNNGEYVLFVVKMDLIPQEIPIYFDPNFPFGVYVTDNLRPNVIVESFNINFKQYESKSNETRRG